MTIKTEKGKGIGKKSRASIKENLWPNLRKKKFRCELKKKSDSDYN